MSKRLDVQSQDILGFKPRIAFVEPDVQPGEILAKEDPPKSEVSRETVQNLAQTLDLLAAATQAQVDLRAKNVKISLDPVVDSAVIEAMRRQFPDQDPTQISFQQYRASKEKIREEGLAIASQAIITPGEVHAVRQDAEKALQNEVSQAVLQMGGNATPEAVNGLLRPELYTRGQIFKPIDMPDLQIKLVCILSNFIWKNFLIKAFDISVKGIGIKNLLPKKICNPGSKIEIPDIVILGEKKKKNKNAKQPEAPKPIPDPKAG